MKYILWDKTSNVYTPSGDEFTADQWKDRYKWAKIASAKCVMAGGVFNGAFMAELEQFRDFYMKQGAPITITDTDEEVLTKAEAWDSREVEQEATAEERIAAALEFQNLNSLEG